LTHRFELYKVTTSSVSDSGGTSNQYILNKMTTDIFESLNLNLSSPVSPMPLPEETATENVLVKMEGNSQQIGFSFKFSVDLVDIETATLSSNQLAHKAKLVDVYRQANNTLIPYVDIIPNVDNSITLLETFLRNFENRSIVDTFIVRVADVDDLENPIMEYGGSLTSLNCTLDSGSPVVWNVNLEFMVGNVISIYDADTPSEPLNFNLSGATPSTSPPTIKFTWNIPSSAGGSSITSYEIHGICLSNKHTKSSSIDLGSLTYDNTNGYYYYNMQSELFEVGETWSFFMFARNTGGRGSETKQIIYKITS
jgi:hypothetical protein